MTRTAPMTTELADLLESHCLGELSPFDAQRLDELVRTDESCCRHYILFMQMHAMAERFDGGNAEHEARRLEALAPPEMVDTAPSPASLQSYPIPQIIIDSTPTHHSPVGSFIFSHVAAAVILGIGLLIGLAWRISLPSSERPTPAVAQAVAHITALANCGWSRECAVVAKAKAQRPKPLFLGDRLILSSGLMQITYDTGAKVILQGPCTYEIDSDRGGYLAVGKLTANVKKGAEIRGPGSGSANHSPLFPLRSPLFAVRTPTAVVTDLGTEFGVEVEQSGATRSHVFQGSISIVPSPNGRGAGGEGTNSRELTTPGAPPLILLAGESAHVKRGRNSKVAIIREPSRDNCFVRQIPNPKSQITKSSATSLTHMSPDTYADYVLSLRPAAYYRMERPKAAKHRRIVFDFAPGGHHGVFCSRDTSVSPYTTGLFGDAMAFRGNRLGDSVVVRSIPPTKNNQLTVVAWIMAEVQPPGSIVASRWNAINNKQPDPMAVRFGISAPLPINCWQHLAYVVNNESGGTTLRVYLNSNSKKKLYNNVWPDLSEVCWGIGGVAPNLNPGPKVSEQYWQGWIDEVAIFHKALSAETIKQLYLGGMSAAKGDRTMNK